MSKKEVKQKETLTEEKAASQVRYYLLASLPRGLMLGKEIQISKEIPPDSVGEIAWNIPVLKNENIKEAVKLLKEQGYKIYIRKILTIVKNT